MPSKNVIKDYSPDSYFHIYNRGVNKMPIFQDENDYLTFISYLKFYLSPINPSLTYPSKIRNNYYPEVKLVAFCLMPNHFHLLLYQSNSHDIPSFLQSLNTLYAKYFNTKYQRIGPLYQGKSKGVKVLTSDQLLYLTIYIHLNPATSRSDLEVFAKSHYSSLPNYLGKISQRWVDPSIVLSLFDTNPHEKYRSLISEHFANKEIEDFPDLHLDE